jgi:hypothetical protein
MLDEDVQLGLSAVFIAADRGKLPDVVIQTQTSCFGVHKNQCAHARFPFRRPTRAAAISRVPVSPKPSPASHNGRTVLPVSARAGWVIARAGAIETTGDGAFNAVTGRPHFGSVTVYVHDTTDPGSITKPCKALAVT